MIATSRPMKLAAVLLAASANAALAVALLREPAVLEEGAPGSSEVRLGSAFEDLVAGTTTAEPTESTAEPVTATPVAPLAEPNTAQPTPPETAQPTDPVTPEPTPPAPAEQAQPVQPVETPPVAALLVPVDPQGVVPIAPTPPETVTAQTAKPVTPEAATPDTVVSGAAPDAASVERSLRPPTARSKAFEQAAKPKAEAFEDAKQAQQRAKAPAPRAKPTPARQGNSDRNARAGASSGSQQATSRSSGSGGRQQQAQGNAAASNYPGVVRSCVFGKARVRGSSGSGTVHVSFTVSGNGSIGGVGVSRSSGNGSADRAAVQAVRGVRRCPAPPAGAQRSFSLRIDVR